MRQVPREYGMTSAENTQRGNAMILLAAPSLSRAKERDFIALYYSYTDKAALTIVCTAPERIAGELRSIPVPDGIVPHYRCFLAVTPVR